MQLSILFTFKKDLTVEMRRALEKVNKKKNNFILN
jgi:hypothetical protein